MSKLKDLKIGDNVKVFDFSYTMTPAGNLHDSDYLMLSNSWKVIRKIRRRTQSVILNSLRMSRGKKPIYLFNDILIRNNVTGKKYHIKARLVSKLKKQ